MENKIKSKEKVLLEKDNVKKVIVQELAFLGSTGETFETDQQVYKDVSKLKITQTSEHGYTWTQVWINDKKVNDGEFAYNDIKSCLIVDEKGDSMYFIPLYTEWD